MSAAPERDAIACLLPECCTFSAAVTREDVAAFPAVPAVFLLTDASAAPVLLARTQNLRRLLLSRLVEAPAEAATKRADLSEVVRTVRWRAVHCAFEARWRHLCAARILYPRDYRRQLDFGPAWYLHVDWSPPIPEISVSERVWIEPGEFAGPWLSRRECAAALDGLRDLFDLCRYPEQVARTPHGKRCAYADMGRCDAPCDGSVPPRAYVERTRAAWRFVCGGAAAWIEAAQARMRSSAAGQRFELAAQIKQQIAFAQHWSTEWSAAVRPVEETNLVLAIPATRRRAWKLFLFRSGRLEDGPLVRTAKAANEVESWLRGALDAGPGACAPQLQMEQAWLVAQFCGSDAARGAVIAPVSPMMPAEAIAANVRTGFQERAAAIIQNDDA
jgi:DNA polymerase-3 subunit epsilon